MGTRVVHVIKPACRQSPTVAGALRTYERRLYTEADILDALALHTGPDDAPASTPAALVQLRSAHRAGHRLVQHRVEVRGRAPRRLDANADRGSATGALFETGALPYRTAARILAVNHKTLLTAIDDGAVARRPDGPIALDSDLLEFARQHARWVPLVELDLPRPHALCPGITAADVWEADATGLVGALCEQGSCEQSNCEQDDHAPSVYTDARWLTWAAPRLRPLD